MNRCESKCRNSGIWVLIIGLLMVIGVMIIFVWPKIMDTFLQIQPSYDTPLNDHALKGHAEAEEVKKAVLSCPRSDLKEFKGLGDFQGRTLLGCTYKDGRKIAIWVVTTIAGSNEPKTVTAFVSKSWSYVDSLVKQGKYVLELGEP